MVQAYTKAVLCVLTSYVYLNINQGKLALNILYLGECKVTVLQYDPEALSLPASAMVWPDDWLLN